MNQDEILEAWKRERQSISPSKDLVARINQIQNRTSRGDDEGARHPKARQTRHRIGLSVAAVLAASVLGIIRISVSLLIGIR